MMKGIGHIRIATYVMIALIILTGFRVLPRNLLALLGAIYVVLGLTQSLLLAGTGKENLRSGGLLFILAIISFFVLFAVFPLFP